jgi:2-oxoisovalerate dehydrogenase E2 component (dihydrolipoyl transacylase)
VAVREFRLPDPGEGLVEADIVSWHVGVGDRVQVNDILVEVETSKSLVELPSPFAGTVSSLLAGEGDTVEVGSPIIAIDDGAYETDVPAGTGREDLVPEIPGPDPAPERAGGPQPGEERVAVLVGYGPRTTERRRRPRKAGADRLPEEARAQVAGSFGTDFPVSRRADDRTPLPPQAAQPIGRPLPEPGTALPRPIPEGVAVLAKPPVRKLARDLGVDLAALAGSGPGGVITRDDVEAASGTELVEAAHPEPGKGPIPEPVAGRPSALQSPSAGSGHEEDVRLPIRGVRKATANAMVQSAFTAPHVSEWVTCDVSATVDLVERLRARPEFTGIRLSPLIIIAKAVCLALHATPELNSLWDESAQEIVLKGAVNLGIAVATPRGLVVPNVKGAHRLSLVDLATVINDTVDVARAGKTAPGDMAGGTFTITNVGVFGVDGGTPILNPGESGILCVGQIARRPWVVGPLPGSGEAEERIVPRWVCTIGISFDHRLADGEQGSRFLADVAGIVTEPGLALIY